MLEQMRYLNPGRSFREYSLYSNAGFFIAGEVAAAADNQSWEDLTDARILRPLNMNRLGTHFETLFFNENHVAGHIGSGGGVSKMLLEVDAFHAVVKYAAAFQIPCLQCVIIRTGDYTSAVTFTALALTKSI